MKYNLHEYKMNHGHFSSHNREVANIEGGLRVVISNIKPASPSTVHDNSNNAEILELSSSDSSDTENKVISLLDDEETTDTDTSDLSESDD